MKKLIKLNKEDLREIVAEKYDVDSQAVDIQVDEVSGLFSFSVKTITVYIDITDKEGTVDADI